MWGASARAHVHTSFERWCLLARSSIADQGVILVVPTVRKKWLVNSQPIALMWKAVKCYTIWRSGLFLISFILQRNKDLNPKRPYFILATQTTDPWSWHRFQEQVRLACCCFEAKLRVFRGTKSKIERYKMFLWLLVYGQRRNFLKNVGIVIKLSCSFYPCNAHTRNVKFLKSWGCTYNPT